MRAVRERIGLTWDDVSQWHLPDGPAERDDWQPILCGGGIVFPGPLVNKPKDAICPECWARRGEAS